MFTVISWCTRDYKHLAEGLINDCKSLGYPYHIYELDTEFPNLAAAWCNHPKVIRRGVDDFGTVLFLDVECRIVRSIPDTWRAPLVSVREPKQHFWITYNTGTVLADRDCIPWLDAWITLVDQWGMDDLPDDAYIYWPNDIGDELPFSAAINALNVDINTVKLSYIDREYPAEIARGLWQNEYTIIQHPTVHHWPKITDLRECKKLFVQNYSGDITEPTQTLLNSKSLVEKDGWVFSGEGSAYAPKEFWPEHKRQWVEADVILTSAQR